MTTRGRLSQIGVSPFLSLKREAHTASSSACDLEVVNTTVIINDAAGFTVSGDAFTNIGLNINSGATSSYLSGFTPPSAVPGRYEKGVRPKVSFLGFGGGDFPPSLSILGSSLEVSGSAGAKSVVAVAVSDTADADAVPDDVVVCFATVADRFAGALASDLDGSAPPYLALVGSEVNDLKSSSRRAQGDEGMESPSIGASRR